MTNPISVLLNKLSTQAPIVRAAHVRYEQALTAYRKRQETSQALHEELDSARTHLSQAKEVWSKLCDELFKEAQQEEQPSSGNILIDKLFGQALHVKVSIQKLKLITDEYKSREIPLHAAKDIAGLQEIRGRLDPAQQAANDSIQVWSELCKELLQTLGQGTPPAEAAAPPAF